MMGMKYTRFWFLLFLLWTGTAVFAQYFPAPHLYVVTVDPETGNDCITWYNCSSPEIDYYRVAIRAATLPGEPDSYLPVVMTILGDTSWCNPNSESSFHPVGYTVWGVDDDGFTRKESLFDHPDSTIYLQSLLDTCKGNISLSWNDYNSWRGGLLLHYNIYRRLGPGLYSLIATVDTNSYEMSNLQINQNYDLFVEAVHIDGIRRSTSNRVSVFTLMSQQPSFINADYATLGAGNTIDLSFTVDATSPLSGYKLLRSTSPGGPFNVIDSVDTDSAHITFTDNTPFTSDVYYYRLEVSNNCGSTSGQSNLANNIILNGMLSGNTIPMQWNSYEDWEGGVETYRIIRTIGLEGSVTDTIDTGTRIDFIDNITDLIDYTNPASSYICYQVEAVERLNVHGIKGRSHSNRFCISVTPNIRMPNAFIPNDIEPVNQVFEPIFSFVPESYELIIYNRLGTRVWSGREPWDGRVSGKYVPEGVYLYLLRVNNFSAETIELSGKVTVVYR